MSFLDRFAWQLTQLSRKAQRPLLVITTHNRELAQLSQALQFFDASIEILPFVDWELLPYERLSPSITHITQRLKVLNQMSQCKTGIIITTVAALMQHIPPKDYVNGYIFDFALNDKIDITQLSQKLSHGGYQRVTTSTLPGEFSVRGSLMDIFPLEAPFPFRVHIDINRIEHLYYFDPITQEPKEPIEKIRTIPTREFLLSEESIIRFREKGHTLLGNRFKNSLVNQQLSATSYAAGTECYLPLFFEKTQVLLDYLPPQTHWVTALDIDTVLTKYWEHIQSRYEQLNNDIHWPLLPPQSIYKPPESLLTQLKAFKKANSQAFTTHELPDFHEETLNHSPQSLKKFLTTLASDASSNKPYKVLFCTSRLSQQEALLAHLQKSEITPKVVSGWQDFLAHEQTYQFSIAPIKKGFWIPDESLLLISETDLYRPTYHISSIKNKDINNAFKLNTEETFNTLAQLAINDTIAHIDHGIGRYLGLHQIEVDQHPAEFIVLEYADNSKLYVPVQDIQYINRYTGQDNPSLDSLNSSRWKKTKHKTLTQLKDVAAELLELYAQRAQAKGEAFSLPSREYEAFSSAFEYEETPDQASAIQAVIEDLTDPKPMDRLVCGDVGFGKTEVAMRAAFLAAQAGKQVAVLAPTTLLADQHYRNFRERFSDWPITLDIISRFRTEKAKRLVKDSLSKGHIDIIIGTHALLSKTIEFKSLGLLIVDEEHHFGVQQKEKLKQLKKHVNVLTLTATPIPRTLQTALSGLRELSLITTPPTGRLPIKNFIVPHESTFIREAVLRELSRGGQVYFVHNRVKSLARVARELEKLVPEAQIVTVHGQLPEKELEARMESFYQQQYNILLCTSIIETGLDIPTVNTLIVDRANHFGLAQLHQLRGRIGRSHHQAYAYFLIQDEAQLTSDAHKRLEALKSLTELGAGFNLASYDLDIRGAGELLGEEQSGVMQGVGFSLYMELLEKTIDAMKEGKNFDKANSTTQTTSLDIKIPAFLPDSYLPDVSLRLQYYRKITKAKDTLSLHNIQKELVDHYGLLPKEGQNLFAIYDLKQKLPHLGIIKIDTTIQGGWIEFSEKTKVDPLRIIELVQKEPHQFKLEPTPKETIPKLRFFWKANATAQEKIDYIKQLLNRLS